MGGMTVAEFGMKDVVFRVAFFASRGAVREIHAPTQARTLPVARPFNIVACVVKGPGTVRCCPKVRSFPRSLRRHAKKICTLVQTRICNPTGALIKGGTKVAPRRISRICGKLKCLWHNQPEHEANGNLIVDKAR